MEDFYKEKLRGIIEKRGKIDSTSARVRPFIIACPKGIPERELENGLYSKEFSEFVLKQDEDPFALPWGECFYWKGYYYPVPAGMDHSEISAKIDQWTDDDVKNLFK